ncbi:hypothetical protein Hanom_Chr02g00141901 [Helianthus anomalus]
MFISPQTLPSLEYTIASYAITVPFFIANSRIHHHHEHLATIVVTNSIIVIIQPLQPTFDSNPPHLQNWSVVTNPNIEDV